MLYFCRKISNHQYLDRFVPHLYINCMGGNWGSILSYPSPIAEGLTCSTTPPFACLSKIEWHVTSLCSHCGLCSLCAAGFTADQPLLKFALCLQLISMVTVCFPPLSPDLVSQSPPAPNANTTYVVPCCPFSFFQYFQTPLHIYLLSHVMSPCILPYSLL